MGVGRVVLAAMQSLGTEQTVHRVTERVIEALSDAVGVDPLAMEAPLYDAVEPDALNSLYADRPHPTVEFEYEGYTVRIKPGARVVVEGEAVDGAEAVTEYDTLHRDDYSSPLGSE